jgi:hypothetical protein
VRCNCMCMDLNRASNAVPTAEGGLMQNPDAALSPDDGVQASASVHLHPRSEDAHDSCVS